MLSNLLETQYSNNSKKVTVYNNMHLTGVDIRRLSFCSGSVVVNNVYHFPILKTGLRIKIMDAHSNCEFI